MRGTLKTSTLESKFPLLRVENNCIISKFADITAAYRVTLPELFTLTAEEYEALHGAWLKALKVLPDYTVVHKQDFFIEERYTAPEEGSERSFLARSYERHFNERPYLRHTCYLFVTKTTTCATRATCSLRRPHLSGCVRRALRPSCAGASSSRGRCATRMP